MTDESLSKGIFDVSDLINEMKELDKKYSDGTSTIGQQKVQRDLWNFKRGQTEERQRLKAEVEKCIQDNRQEIDYFLCYGLKQELTEDEIESFKKIFIALYEDKLKKRLGIK